MSASYLKDLDLLLGVGLWVDFSTVRGRVVGYRVVLLLGPPEERVPVRVYDSAHGFNEMHRYTPAGGKQTGTPFHSGTLGEGLNAAIKEATQSYESMIEGWKR